MKNNNNVAVVFAYHNVGVRGLASLLACGVQVALVVTHQDSADENIWFDSVEALALLNDIPVIKPSDPNAADVIETIRAHNPEWFFSFYYRNMLGADLLELPRLGAYNLHGSLLPKYRGRVPINWAIIHGETETGVSLHRMEIKPDAGALVDQQAIPILANDTADQVFSKATCAAEVLLLRAIPKLLNGHAEEVPMNLREGSYFGGRKPNDGLINWHLPAQQIHNLIRAVAPPYPGAFFETNAGRVTLLGSYFRGLDALPGNPSEESRARMYWHDGRCWVDCIDGKRFCVTQLSNKDGPLTEAIFTDIYGSELFLTD